MNNFVKQGATNPWTISLNQICLHKKMQRTENYLCDKHTYFALTHIPFSYFWYIFKGRGHKYTLWSSESPRDEHKYSNIRIFKSFGARINICIRFHDKVHIRIYSNIRSVLSIYSNNTECFERTWCSSSGPKILREHSPSLVYHVSLVK